MATPKYMCEAQALASNRYLNRNFICDMQYANTFLSWNYI
jgi:hypothetical protein